MKETNKEYAKALFMLATEQNCVEEYSGHLESLFGIVKENPAYTEFLSSPAIPLSERMAAIDEAFSKEFPEQLLSFLKLLLENGRIHTLSDCIYEFFELQKQASNCVDVTVYSAIPLSEEQKTALVKKLEKVHQRGINAAYVVEKSLMGGIKIELEDKVLDGSIEKRLQKVKEVINA